jgi:hypothetical protein
LFASCKEWESGGVEVGGGDVIGGCVAVGEAGVAVALTWVGVMVNPPVQLFNANMPRIRKETIAPMWIFICYS